MTDTPILCTVGEIVSLEPIPNANKLEQAKVYCRQSGVWYGVVPKDRYDIGGLVNVYLQDAIVPADEFPFLEKYHYRIRIQKLRGALSEVLITDLKYGTFIGEDVTMAAHVTKYEKPIPTELSGQVRGNFPTFIPKTDEPNFQTVLDVIDDLRTKKIPVVVTLKADGTSMTVYRHEGHFGVCSRNWELTESDSNAYWKMARALDLPNTLPEGMAIQGELVGPGIQKNPMRWTEQQFLAFNVYDIRDQVFMDPINAKLFLATLNVRTVDEVRRLNVLPEDDQLRQLSRVFYALGIPGEGVVVRPFLGDPLNRSSFKIINPDYKEG